MSLIGNFVKAEIGIEPAFYRVDDLSSFRYFQAGDDVGELQAFSKSHKKWIGLYWFNHPNGLEHAKLEDNQLVKEINHSISESRKWFGIW